MVTFYFQTKVEAMECEHIPYVTEESLNDKNDIETEATVAASSVMEEEVPAATINTKCNKEKVHSEERGGDGERHLPGYVPRPRGQQGQRLLRRPQPRNQSILPDPGAGSQ